MERNPYEYNNYEQFVPWQSQQQQYEGSHTVRHTLQRNPVLQAQRPSQGGAGQKPKLAKPMPKARALELVSKFKKWIIVASLATFVSIGGCAAFQQVSATTNTTSSNTAAASTSSNSTSSTSSNTAAASTSSAQQSSNNNSSFLNQGGSNIGSTGSSSSAVSSTHTS